MTRILFTVAIVGVWLSGAVAAHAGDDEFELTKQLIKHGVNISAGRYKPSGWIAEIDVSRADPRKVGDVLRRTKNLDGIRLSLSGAKLTDEQLKLIKDCPTVKYLDISATQLSEKEMQGIASLKQVEDLTLSSMEFSAAQIRPLEAMKGLKTVTLLSAKDVPPTALADLKNALGKETRIDADRPPAIYFFQPLKAAPDDSPATKLKKEKFNAALSAAHANEQKIRVGTKDATRSSVASLEIARALKEAILDLDDPAARLRAIDGYVDLMKRGEEETRINMENGAQGIGPDRYQMARYHYLDAQLLQLQLRKQAEKK